jgi:nucleoid DNA-binding protein
MKLDPTLIKILEKIQTKLIKEKGTELSIEEIHNIVDFQLTGLSLGVSKGFDVQWVKIGTFTNTDKKARRRERYLSLEEIESLKRDNPTFNDEEARKELILKLANKTKENKKNKTNIILTGEELLKADIIKSPKFIIFKDIHKNIRKK